MIPFCTYHALNGCESCQYQLMFNAEDVQHFKAEVVYLHAAHSLLSKGTSNLGHLEDTGGMLDKLRKRLQ